MRSHRKKVLSAILAAAIAFSMNPQVAAAEPETSPAGETAISGESISESSVLLSYDTAEATEGSAAAVSDETAEGSASTVSCEAAEGSASTVSGDWRLITSGSGTISVTVSDEVLQHTTIYGRNVTISVDNASEGDTLVYQPVYDSGYGHYARNVTVNTNNSVSLNVSTNSVSTYGLCFRKGSCQHLRFAGPLIVDSFNTITYQASSIDITYTIETYYYYRYCPSCASSDSVSRDYVYSSLSDGSVAFVCPGRKNICARLFDSSDVYSITGGMSNYGFSLDSSGRGTYCVSNYTLASASAPTLIGLNSDPGHDGSPFFTVPALHYDVNPKPDLTGITCTASSSCLSFSGLSSNYYYTIADSEDYLSAGGWQKPSDGTLSRNGLSANHTCYLLAKNFSDEKCFASYSSRPFTTEKNSVYVSLAPSFRNGSDTITTGDCLSADNLFYKPSSISGATISNVKYFLDGQEISGSYRIPVTLGNTCILSMSADVAPSSDTEKIVSVSCSTKTLKVVSGVPVISQREGAEDYYSTSSDIAEYNVIATLKGSRMSGRDVYFSLSRDNVSKNAISSDGWKNIHAGNTIYVQAYSATGLSSNILALYVNKRPLKVTVSRNFFSERGKAATDGISENITDLISKNAISVSDCADFGGSSMELGGIDELLLPGKLYYDFSAVNTSGIYQDKQKYSIKSLKCKSPDDYTIAWDGPSDGYGYYVLPYYKVSFERMSEGYTVSAPRLLSSNALSKISYYSNNCQYTSVSSMDFGTSLTLPSSTEAEAADHCLKLLCWYDKAGKQYDVGESSVPVSADCIFYAFLGRCTDEQDREGMLLISDIPAVTYTGLKHVSASDSSKALNISKDLSISINDISGCRILTEGTDYTLSYRNSINASTGLDSSAAGYEKKLPAAVITFRGQYRGIKAQTVYFRIKPADISDALVSCAKEYYPAFEKCTAVSAKYVKVTLGSKTYQLKKSRDYDISINSAVGNPVYGRKYLSNTGFYYIIAVGKGNFTGNASSFSAVNASRFYVYDTEWTNVSKLRIVLAGSGKTFKWNGNTQKPSASDFTIFSGRTKLDNDNFSFSFPENSSDAGTYTVRISSVSASSSFPYYGWKDVQYRITPSGSAAVGRISTGTVSFSGTGTYAEGAASVSISGLVKGTDYTVSSCKNDSYILPGSHKLYLAFIGKYAGNRPRYAKYNVAKADLSDISIISGNISKTYTRSGAVTLEAGTDYMISFNGTDITNLCLFRLKYSDNKKAGKACLKFVPVVKYVSDLKKTAPVSLIFDIARKDLSADTIYLNYVSGCGLDSKAAVKKGMLIVKDNEGYVLKYGTDYTAVISANTPSEGMARVTVEGLRNYKSQVTKERLSLAGLLSGYTVTLKNKADSRITYTGNSIVPEVTVSRKVKGVTAELTAGSDYTVHCANNIYPGRASLYITGLDTGKYGDTAVYGRNSISFIIK